MRHELNFEVAGAPIDLNFCLEEACLVPRMEEPRMNVTYSGNEVAYVAGAIVNQMSKSPSDFELLDLMLDRAIAVLEGLDDEVLAKIETERDVARKLFEKQQRTRF